MEKVYMVEVIEIFCRVFHLTCIILNKHRVHEA